MKRFTVALVIIIIACGHAPPKPVVKPALDASVVMDAAIIEAGPPKIDLLAQKHDKIAPGTREIEKREIDLAKDHELALALAAFEADTCLRAVFDADAPTAVTLVNAHGTTLARADGEEGTLGAAGPVCFKKGDTATFQFDGGSKLRLVIWASP